MKHIATVLLLGLLTWACGGNSPISPVSSSGMTGTWSGSSHDTTGQETMGWNITQNGSSLSGTMSFADTGRGMMGNGTMTGTVNGNTVTFHMSVPMNGFTGMMSSCSMGADGQATMSADGHTMTGTYSGTMSGMMSGGMMGQSCGGAMSNGQFTLTR